MYDVIVIGAGPAGSSAARELAMNGFRVLLLEKFKMPRNKSCSGVLIKKSMDLIVQYFGESVPADTYCAPSDNRGMIFKSDDGKEYRYEQKGLNIWRSKFDHWLAQKAAEAGAELRDGTAAVALTEDCDGVEVRLKGTKEYSEQAKFLIVCDGVVGSIKRKLRTFSENYITTYQTFNHGSVDLDPHYFYAYLQPQLSEYDAWFNVKDDYLILGVSVKDTTKADYYYQQFLYYMEQHYNLKIEKQEKAEKWLMPHILPGCPIDYGTGRVLLAGETAGFLNPMGEGISAAMESGHAAAEAIWRCGLNPCDNDCGCLDCDLDKIYSAYRGNTDNLKKYMERQWSYVANMAATFAHMKPTAGCSYSSMT